VDQYGLVRAASVCTQTRPEGALHTRLLFGLEVDPPEHLNQLYGLKVISSKGKLESCFNTNHTLCSTTQTTPVCTVATPRRSGVGYCKECVTQ
jgi:hypothetical protein